MAGGYAVNLSSPINSNHFLLTGAAPTELERRQKPIATVAALVKAEQKRKRTLLRRLELCLMYLPIAYECLSIF